MILFDTNVLVYAVGADHPLREPARTSLRAVADGAAGRTTPEVVQEFAHVYARGGRDRTEAVKQARALTLVLGPLIPVEEQDLDGGLDLWKRHKGLGAFDSVLAALAIRLEASLLSADRGLGKVRGLRLIDLSDPDLTRRMAEDTKI